MYDKVNIDSFLKFGYFLDYTGKLNILDKIKNNENYLSMELPEIVEEFNGIFLKVIEKNFKSNEINVLPLSGGYDSRALLAGLLEFTEARNILTYTFGIKNTLDFEIGNKLATRIGTNHTPISLENMNYKLEDMMEISSKIDHQSLLFIHGPIKLLEEYYKGASIWSGFMGGVIGGSQYFNSENLSKVYENFLEENNLVRSYNLTSTPLDKLVKLIEIPDNYNKGTLTLNEIVDIKNKQEKYLAPHILASGFNYKTPFIDEDILNFVFNIKGKYRDNKHYYKKWIMEKYSNVFEVGTKNTFGLPMDSSFVNKLVARTRNKIATKISPRFNTVNPYTNYFDFNKEIITNSSLKSLIKGQLIDLKERDILNIDPIMLYNKHISQKEKYGDALLALASLEIHLKSTEVIGN
jgi:hypothetical protein